MASLPPAPLFPRFPDLPVEIRLRVWHLAAPRRPRVIQVGYDPDRVCWKAWEDGCGGLPSIVRVSREARQEALKPYTRVFDTYIDLDEDMIFISDPLFSIRSPRNIFLRSEYVNQIRNVALSNDVYNGLGESFEQFPDLCESPAAILRKLEGLSHFALALSEDGAGFDFLSSEEEDEDEGDEDGDEHDEDEEPPASGNTAGPANESNTVQIDAERGTENEDELEDHLDEDAVERQFLDRLEEEAMDAMSRGYFRHKGNIHFESAVSHPDHWESWAIYKEDIVAGCEQEKEKFPDWIRPKVSIMAVAYGLKRLGDFETKFHSLGDYSDGALERDDNDYGDDTQSDPV